MEYDTPAARRSIGVVQSWPWILGHHWGRYLLHMHHHHELSGYPDATSLTKGGRQYKYCIQKARKDGKHVIISEVCRCMCYSTMRYLHITIIRELCIGTETYRLTSKLFDRTRTTERARGALTQNSSETYTFDSETFSAITVDRIRF